MERTFESGRQAVTFRADGWLRFLPAGFLAFWMCGWVVGEVFAAIGLAWTLWQVLLPSRPFPFQVIKGFATPPPVGVWFVVGFLAVWLFFWTIAGVSAAWTLLRALWGSDRIEWDGAGVRRVARAGPLRTVREWAAPDVTALVLARRMRGLAILSRGRTEELTTFGTPAERRAVRDEIAAALGLGRTSLETAGDVTLPAGWEVTPDPAGGTRIESPRRGRARAAGFVSVLAAAFVAAAVFGPITESQGVWTSHAVTSTIVLGLIALALGLVATWLGVGRAYYRVRPQSLERCWRLGEREWTVAFRPAALRVTRRLDSDNDEWFGLVAVEGDKVRGVESVLSDPLPMLRLGRWLAARLECPFEAGPGVEDDTRAA